MKVLVFQKLKFSEGGKKKKKKVKCKKEATYPILEVDRFGLDSVSPCLGS